MRNLTLLRGPCNFLNLRIIPWEVLFLLLLSVFLLSGISSVPPTALLLGAFPCLPPSACFWPVWLRAAPSSCAGRPAWIQRHGAGGAERARGRLRHADAAQRWSAGGAGAGVGAAAAAGVARARVAHGSKRGALAHMDPGDGAQARGGAVARGWWRPGVPSPVSSCAGERLQFPSPWAQHQQRSGLAVLEHAGEHVRRCCSTASRGGPAQGAVEPRVVDVGGC
jgi:hypothetical protein